MKLSAEGIAVIEGDTYLSQDIINQGRLDVAKDFLEQFRQYIPVGGTVVDVGASLGDYTATFSEFVGSEGKVYAFEPNPPTFECLIWNMRIVDKVLSSDHGFGGIETFELGLGGTIGEWGAMIVDTNNIGGSRIEPAEGGKVRMTTLDHWVVAIGLPRLDFLKIDAEGWEPLILDGGKETINRFRPVMLIEVNTWPLGKMGFTAEDVFSRLDALNYSFPRFDGPYGDILCLPKERA